MLCYRTYPHWRYPDGTSHALPQTLPAALVLMLAARADWVAREVLAAQIWPDVAAHEAGHRLRLTLHRSRQLLRAWGVEPALQAERARLKLALPTDLEGAIGAAEGAELLAGWRIAGPGSEGVESWLLDLQASRRRRGAMPGQAAGPSGGAGPAGAPAAASRSTQCGAPAPEPEQAIPAALPPDRPLAGRQRELQAVRAPFERGVGAMLVVGEPGIGKTTLLRHACPGALLLAGREALQDMPYRALADLLRQNLGPLRASLGADATLSAYRLDLARLLPELAPGEPLPALDALTARHRLLEALALAVEGLGAWLLVDDLPWCDESTLAWLSLLSHRGRVRWIASARPFTENGAIAQLLRPLRENGLLEVLALDGLAPEGLAEAFGPAFTARHGQAASGADWAELARASGGNPFLAAELLASGPAVPLHPALSSADAASATSVPPRVRALLLTASLAWSAPVRALAEAAAVLGEPVTDAVLAQAAMPPATGAADIEAALAARVLQRTADGRLACRHDLLRHALLGAMPPSLLATRHGAAMAALAAAPEPEPLAVAHHAERSTEPAQAWHWLQSGARWLKARGELERARALWTRLWRECPDPGLSLRAQLELAAAEFFSDLEASRRAVEAVAVQLPALPPSPLQRQLQARVDTALVDNAVFSGDLPRARRHAESLRESLPQLPLEEQVDAHEVLIELAMREPDEPACWRHLHALRQLAPRRPQVLSFEGQIHWFTGDIRAAHAALAELLRRHPEHRRGLTIDNDLAVMLQALGRLDEAEAAARASLRHWAGVAHTETLSYLVLGLVQTSAGRHDEALRTLAQGLQLARAQASPGFEAEAQVRLARLHLQRGALDAAAQALAAARPVLQGSPEPLRVSQWMWVESRLALAQGALPTLALRERLADVASRSRQALVQLRALHVQGLLAVAQQHPAEAEAAAQSMRELARRAGTPEPEVEALLLAAEAASQRGHRVAARSLRDEAAAISRRCGFAALREQAGQA